MKIYCLSFDVSPTLENEHFESVKSASVVCWILENDTLTASTKAEYFILKNDWMIERVKTPPVEVSEDTASDGEWKKHFNQAREEGSSLLFFVQSRGNTTNSETVNHNPIKKYNIGQFIDTQKKLRNQKRCLHFDSDGNCTDIIRAHSIQNNQSLASISKDGHVYTLSSHISSLRKNKGFPIFKKEGVSKVSTFKGFCKKHDNELFDPIDNHLLSPTHEQVVLYAYRSLCREIFVKENALNLFKSQLNSSGMANVDKSMVSALCTGTEFGLKNLNEHKSQFDNSLKLKKYDDVRYDIFISHQKPIIHFSGLIYPVFDFMGRQLQNLANLESSLDLLTFCSAPTASGWAYIFAWHESSQDTCVHFMKSLAMTSYNGLELGDLLFRMAINNCENLAIAPEWWEQLHEKGKEEIQTSTAMQTNPFSTTKPTYLMEGLEGISKWEFGSVISTKK